MNPIRTIRVDVDEATWEESAFPPALRADNETYDIDVLMLLLWIGYLTIPTSLRGVSISEYWAWIRYVHALSDHNDLRVSSAFAELDPHQKTILSDDFGMGLPVLWLNERLQFESITDGRNFMDRMRGQVGANASGSKVGPTKSPDFIARDTSKVWYVIECKGTQSGPAYRNRQLHEPATQHRGPRGAVTQKNTIQFDPGIAHERLACGVSLATEGKEGSSDLRIIDPPPEQDDAGFLITDEHRDSAIDALSRGRFGRVLRLTGLRWTASAVATPPPPSKKQDTAASDEGKKREEFDEKRKENAKKELRNCLAETKKEGDKDYYVRDIKLELPVPIDDGNRLQSSAVLRFRLNAEFLEELQTDPTIGKELSEGSALWGWTEGLTKLTKDEGGASMQIGNLFSARIEIAE